MKEAIERFGLPALALGVVVSLGLNIVLLSQWFGFRNDVAAIAPEVQAAVDQGIADLEDFRGSSIEFTVNIDEVVNIDTVLPVSERFVLPVDTNLPIDQRFESRIEVQGPFGLGIPVTVEIPVILDVPINLQVPVDFDTDIDVDLDVPIRLNVPLSVEVADTELAALTSRLEGTLRALAEALGGLS